MTSGPALQPRPPLPFRLVLAALVMGITALIAQVVLTRELLSLFLGNELSIAFVLAVWLAAVATGSALGGRLAPHLLRPERALAWSQLALALLLPAALLFSRSAQPPGLTPFEAWGPGAMLLVSLETLGLVSLLAGIQFVFAAAAGLRHAAAESVSPVAYVYALEAAGAMLAGIAFHFWLSQHTLAFGAFALVGLLNVASALALLRPRISLTGAALALPALLLGAALAALLLRAPAVDLASVQSNPRWTGFTVLSHTPSKYGDLTAALRQRQLSLFQSGVLVFTTEQAYADEVTAHLPLLQHPAPRRLLLLGGVIGELPEKALQHPVERLDCIELDPKLLEAARRAARRARLELPLDVLDDPRAHLEFGDARLFLQQSPPVYDVIIANVPDPTTAALNRFYTLEFFREARRALAPGGLLAVTLTGSPHHLSGPLLLAAATTDTTLRQIFPDVLLVPGETMFFLAARDPDVLSRDPDVLARRLRQRGLQTDFVNEDWLRDALLPFRADLIQQQLSQVPAPPLNTDLNPVSYYHQTRIWLDQLSPRLALPMKTLSHIEVWWAALPLALALILISAARGRSPRLRALAVLVAAAAIGGFGMMLEIVGLLVFQAARGYLYHAIGALIAAFMAGLAAGAAALSSRRLDPHTSARLLAAGLLTSALIAALLPGLLQGVLPAPGLAGAAIGLLLLLVGSLVGAAFPLAVALYRRERTPAPSGGAIYTASGGAVEAASGGAVDAASGGAVDAASGGAVDAASGGAIYAASGGAIYAADLIGSAGAAVFAGALALPLLGVVGTCRFTALLLAAALVLALPLLRKPA